MDTRKFQPQSPNFCLLLAMLLGLVPFTAAAEERGNLRAGAARVEITDLVPSSQPASGRYAHEQLFIRAIVVDAGATRAALIGVDRADMDEPIWQIASKSVATELSCPVRNIVMSATHSHSAFMPTFGPDGPHLMGDPAKIAGRMLEAVRQAKAALRPARVGFGTGLSYLNVNRDNIDPDTHLWTQIPNLSAPSDKTVAVVKFESGAGEPIAVFMTYAMHPVNGYLSAYLRSLSVQQILKASPPYMGAGEGRPEPSIDGYAVTEAPAESFRAGREATVPFITGNTGREFDFRGDAAALRKAVADFYGPLAEKALALYSLAGAPVKESYSPYGGAGAQFSTDMAFRCPGALIAAEHAAHFPTYQYEFTAGPEATGVPHSGELQYVFGRRGVKESADPDPQRTAEVQGYWVNFASTGDPNGRWLPPWPRYEPGGRAYLEFTAAGPVVKYDLRQAVCALFNERMERI